MGGLGALDVLGGTPMGESGDKGRAGTPPPPRFWVDLIDLGGDWPHFPQKLGGQVSGIRGVAK